MVEVSELQLQRLFICNADCLLEEDPSIVPVVIDASSYVRNKLEQRYTYFYHPTFGNPQNKEWPQKTNLACLHCTETFNNQPFPSVRRIDDLKNMYYVYGNFCSLNCVKGYLIEHEPSLSTLRLLYFTQMCKNVYNVHESIKPAPPRIRLQKFGGDLTIEEFRRDFLSNVVCSLIAPPFIQSEIQFETYSTLPIDGANDIIDKHEQKCLYDEYLEKEGAFVPEPPIQPPPKKEKPAPLPKKRKIPEPKPPKKQPAPKKAARTITTPTPCFNLKQFIEQKKK